MTKDYFGVISSSPVLRDVLNRWISLIKEITPGWVALDDAPWWYNERASLSTFVGAIWLLRGEAFEEYCERRAKRAGRIDLWFALGQNDYVVEAKQCWPSIGHKGRPIDVLRCALRKACNQVRSAPTYNNQKRLALAFVVPRLPLAESSVVDSQLRSFVRGLTKAKWLSRAWAFPRITRGLRGGKWIYPGIGIGIASVDSFCHLSSNSRRQSPSQPLPCEGCDGDCTRKQR